MIDSLQVSPTKVGGGLPLSATLDSDERRFQNRQKGGASTMITTELIQVIGFMLACIGLGIELERNFSNDRSGRRRKHKKK